MNTTFMNEIYCFGDGYAYGHIWPEWPQILKALLPEYNVIVHAGIGAGNEFLIDKLLSLGNSIDDQAVVFQWAQANRYDKLIEDQQWVDLAKSDPIYYFNFETCGENQWWLSSNSQLQEVQQYHKFFLQNKQAQNRFMTQRILIQNYLENHNCLYVNISTAAQHWFSQQPRFSNVVGTAIQPSPIVHLSYLLEVIIPNLKIEVNSDRRQTLSNLINSQTWIPYDPNRIAIWEHIVSNLSS